MPTPAEERVLRATPALFARGIVAPLQLQLQPGDFLRVRWFSAFSTGAETLTLSYRILTPDGTIVWGQETISVGIAFQFQTLLVAMREGYLLSLAMTALAFAQLGQIWVQAYVCVPQSKANMSDTTQDLILTPLIQGFLTGTQMITWPGSLFSQASESTWYRATYRPADPAAGTNWTQAVPAGVDWKPIAISALFTTSVAIANRFPIVGYSTGAPLLPIWNSPRVPAMAASTSVRVCWARGTPHPNTITQDVFNDSAPLDIILLGGNDNIAAGCIAIQAADQWSQVQITVQERLVLQ